MGDILEFQTIPNHRPVFYKITSSAISFDVKGAGNAYIGLTRILDGKSCDVWIGLGIGPNRDLNIIYKKGTKPAKLSIPNSISVQNYSTFTISWYSGRMRLQAQSVFPMQAVSLKPCEDDPQYITFFNTGNINSQINWRIELPPQRPCSPLKPITGGAPTWVACADVNHLPDGAMIGGFENENLYIIRAEHHGALTPGKFVPSKGAGYIGWSWDAHKKKEFEILCGYDVAWVAATANSIPTAAVVGGHSEQNEPLYVGRAKHQGHLVPGKVHLSHRVCFIAYEKKEIAKPLFEVLVAGAGSRAANRLLYQKFNDVPSVHDLLRPYDHSHSSDTEPSDDDENVWIAAF